MTPADGPGRFEPPQMPRHPGAAGDDRPTEPRPDVADRAPVDEHDVVTVHDRPHPHRRRLLLTAGIAVLVVVAVIAAGLVWGQGSPLTQPPPSGATTATATAPLEPITLPEQFGSYARKAASETRGPIDSADDLVVSSATYTQNGVDSILLIAAGPTQDMRSFLLSLGASGIREVEGGYCATYQEVVLCGVVADARAYAVAPLADQTDGQLITIAREASAA